jgi:hypothetical protein
MKPEWRPPSTARNGGRPDERLGLTIDSMRRSEIEPSSCSASAAWSMAIATGSPWKLPPERTSPSSAKTSGLSVAELISR